MGDELNYDLKIDYLEGPCPMQGWGTIAGHQFFFRARWDRWTFAVAESADVDPVDIDSTEQGFYKEELYGNNPYAAGYMPKDEAEAIVKRCAREYLTQMNKG